MSDHEELGISLFQKRNHSRILVSLASAKIYSC